MFAALSRRDLVPEIWLPDPSIQRGARTGALSVLALGLAALPVVGLLALLVRRDGGPALFVQTRIGEGGRAFRLYKLRTMRAGDEAAWAQDDDPRATPIGRIMRRTHCDELPQLWNILRGEMSFVGPRPEQVAFVARLEPALPFYQRRHLIRPGLTGWAQVRCGYAGTDVGAAWKLCHDLYYVKHRSIGLDLLLLAETAGLLTIGRAIGAQPPIAAADWVPALPVVVPAADDVKVVAIADAAEATP